MAADLTVHTLALVLLGLPVLAAGLSMLMRSPRAVLRVAAAAVVVYAGLTGWLALRAWQDGLTASAGDGQVLVDALSVFHLGVLALTYLSSSIFSLAYFQTEVEHGHLDLRGARRFAGLWLLSLTAMTLILVSNNLGLMWVGMETTTILTAFLVSMHGDRLAIEAMWKYLIVCSVGIAFAFMGTLLAAAAGQGAQHLSGDALMWTQVMAERGKLDPQLMRTAFIFLTVGYGTKAGLAPMHTWLPDAHSQAPAPVSAMFSGFMLNAALYCLLRYLPLVEATSPGFGFKMLLGFGLASMAVAATFAIFQRDAKRLLAYSSVEHLGIIALGYGLGPLGAAAALFHTLNHSIAKSLAFFSVGRLGQRYGSHDMDRIRGALKVDPIYGSLLIGSFLAVIAVAPFGTFMSEFQVARAAVLGGHTVSLGVLLVATSVVFIAALRRGISMVYGDPPADVQPVVKTDDNGVWVGGLSLTGLVVLGLWMPGPLVDVIDAAVSVLEVAP